MDRQARVVYRGTVQGVGFRYTVRELGKQMGVRGGVENLPDGSVRLIAEGAEELVRNYLERIRRSRVGPFIEDEAVEWRDAEGLRGFYWR